MIINSMMKIIISRSPNVTLPHHMEEKLHFKVFHFIKVKLITLNQYSNRAATNDGFEYQ